MKRATWTLILCVVAMLAACNKDNDDIQPTQNGYTGPKRLASITAVSYSQSYNNYNPETGQYELSSTSGSKNGATLRWSPEGLLLSMGMDTYIASDLIKIEYDGKKIKTIVINVSEMSGSANITYTCSYTGDNLTQLYASVPGQGWSMTTLTYSPNGELLTMREESSDGDLTLTSLVWDNGNVTHVEKTNSNSHSSNTYTYTFDYLYDNKTSVYKGMDVYALLGSEHFMLSKNNVLRAIDNYHSSNYDTTIYTYTYDGDWPISYSSSHSNSSPYSGGYRSENTNYLRYTDGSGATAPQTYRINATTNMPNNEYLQVSGGGDYEAGRMVMLNAGRYYYDTTGAVFQCWSDGITDNPRILTVTGDASYVAIFSLPNNK